MTTYASTNPAELSDVVTRVELVPAEEFAAVAGRDRRAQREWAGLPAPVRGQVVANVGRLVEANAEALARVVTREIGKPLVEARGEVREVVDTCTFFSGEGRRLYGRTVPSEMPDKHLFTFREPIGGTVVVTAGNFPVAVPSWSILPSLLCGNSVVWKPAEYAAASAQAFYDVVTRAGVPEDVFHLVFADGEETFRGLELGLEQRVVDKVAFTGSSAVGARIGALCGRHVQSPCLELGGKNPMVVTEDADLDLAVRGALFSGFGTAGQRCTSLGTVIVHEDVHDEFVRRFAAAVATAVVGDPFDEGVLYGPLLDEKFAVGFEEHLGWIGDHHVTHGSTGSGRITNANPRRGFRGDPERGLYYHPVVVDGVRPDDDLFQHETFGPIVGVTTYRALDEAIELGNLPGYGLSSAIYTTDPVKAFAFRKGIGAGMVSVNNSTSGAEAHLPFGGNGRSGNGSRQSGVWVLDQFTRWQSVNWDHSGSLQKAQVDTLAVEADLDFRLA
ncbi:aldehyde dehydrogenase family protein [Saccharothrix saharensis]|uniref:aldehyde dehydrogenase family protein n=1 Tax=Saccharothrix saharensis TaxID=571190 RepID=UPI0036789F88